MIFFDNHLACWYVFNHNLPEQEDNKSGTLEQQHVDGYRTNILWLRLFRCQWTPIPSSFKPQWLLNYQLDHFCEHPATKESKTALYRFCCNHMKRLWDIQSIWNSDDTQSFLPCGRSPFQRRSPKPFSLEVITFYNIVWLLFISKKFLWCQKGIVVSASMPGIWSAFCFNKTRLTSHSLQSLQWTQVVVLEYRLILF